MSIHTATDNLVGNFINNLLKAKQPTIVADIVEALNDVPEYKEGKKRGEGPTIFSGEPSNRIGKLSVSEFTGGTGPGKELYEYLGRIGVGTVVGMHMAEDSRDEAEKQHINVVMAGHMSSDSLGMNLLVDELVKQNKGLEIIPASGYIRISRN